MKLKFLAFFILGTGSLMARQVPVFTPTQLREDLKVFVTSLKELHPGLYRYQDSLKFNERVAAIDAQLGRALSEEEYFKLIMPLVASIRCGHTKWHRKDRPDDRFPFQDNGIFPLQLYFADNRAYVLKAIGTNALPPGTEITHINHQPVEKIIHQLKEFITRDGNVESAIEQELNQFFQGYYATFIGTPAVHHVRFNKNGRSQAVKLKGLKLVQWQMATKPTPSQQGSIRLKFNDDIPVLTIERFWLEKQEMNFHSFIDSAFKAVKDRKSSKLVIDLRNNEGGVEEFGGYLFSYIAKKPFTYYKKIKLAGKGNLTYSQYAWLPPQLEGAKPYIQEKDGEFTWPLQEYLKEHQPQAHSFQGEVIVLINGRSFSVTSEFAAVVRSEQRATFIGEETAGAYEGDNSGVFASVTLPNTKLTVGIPLMAFYMNVESSSQHGRGILPDKNVKPVAKEILQGLDPVMEAATRK